MRIYDFSAKFSGFERPLRFSWKMSSERQAVMQTAYRIKIGDVYDSGKQWGDRSVAVPVPAALDAQTEYACSVEVWNNYGEKASARCVLTPPLGCFTAPFIAPDCGAPPNSFTAAKRFVLRDRPQKAVLYATALGLYEAEINGQKAGDSFLAPFWTSYNKMLQFQAYDVTELLDRENLLSFYVGKGWYRGTVGFSGKKNWYGTESAVACELHLWYSGRKETIRTGTDWSLSDNFIVDSEIFDGEFQDFTRALKSYPVKEVAFDHAKLVPQINEPIAAVQRIAPVHTFTAPNGEQIFDFGVNISGFAELTVCGKRGQHVTLRHAELLDDGGNLYTENLRMAKAEDRYILSGDVQTLRPKFTFHGFRYIAAEGAAPDENSIFAIAISSKLEETGSVVTSDRALNRLIDNVKRSQRDNFLDVPTDCPQRDERCGWTADANVFARTAAYNYQCGLFFEKWLRDLKNDMREDGSVPFVVPDVSGKAGTPALWADAVTMIPYTMYEMYGDKAFLENAYGCMKRYAEKVISNFNGNGLIADGFQYGDWLALDRDELMPVSGAGSTDSYLVANIFFNRSLQIVARCADLLGKAEDSAYFERQREKHLKDIVQEYFTANGRMVSETQTACALALHFHIAPEGARDNLVKKLIENLERHGDHLTTGFAGTPYLLFALSDNGSHDKAVKLLLGHGYPSWLYAVDRGATTVWERWNGILPDGTLNDPSMNSFNHYAYGSVLEFIYRRIAGIDCASAGFKHSLLRPMPSKGITHIKAAYESVYGTIECGYASGNGKADIEVCVPPNTTATVLLPDGTAHEVGSGRYAFTVDCGDLSAERLSMDTKVEDILSDAELLAACNQAGGNLFASPRIRAVRSMTLRQTAALAGKDGEAGLQAVVDRANRILRGE